MKKYSLNFLLIQRRIKICYLFYFNRWKWIFLNYNLKNKKNDIFLNKGNNIDFISWEVYINKIYKVKYSIYFLYYYIEDGDFIFNKYWPNDTFISNNENLLNYSLKNLVEE